MIYDLIVIGGGPAGLTAALYARRAGKAVLIIEKETFGGQITFSPKVENIPGFLSLSGNEFAEKLVDQVLAQGAETECAEVLEVRGGDVFTVVTDTDTFSARTVIFATGAKHRLLGLAREENYIGNGISFCAVCDGAFYAGRTVGVVGGGNSALQEALLLSEQCKKVYVIQNLDYLTGEQRLCDQLGERDNVEILTGTTVEGFPETEEFTGVLLRHAGEPTCRPLSLDGLFVAIGLCPQNDAFRDLLPLDERGYVEVGESCTLGNGLFAAGDCRRKTVRQVTTAAADGAAAALAACAFLDKRN